MIELKHLGKIYSSASGSVEALKDVNLTIADGEIFGIIGLSGAGKSSAATYLEDMGYYTVDNVPADIILKFAEFCAQSDGRYDRVALVSDIRGTTRDVIEDTITLGGLTFRFIDTAGIRQTTDAIETMGIERTFKKLDEAAIILWMIDGTQPVANIATVAADILPHAEGKHLVAVINKIDCLSDADISALRSAVATAAPSAAIATISAKADIAVDSLEQSLIEAAAVADTDPNAVIVTNARHYDALLHAGEAIRRALDGLRSGISGDFVSQDIRECMHYLGEITGEITTHEILGSIFSRFCIGK